eukprot:TRINITY_DN5179_c0_g1_i2.p2 TRINITY_DN5179_c0_g1~~TRINITY_DN5179_c0_g1_i2.p2  ORF type:complete len:191 (+),score=46.12 TRINITY_DN5179_c0_g1_i2:1720-2292(+)
MTQDNSRINVALDQLIENLDSIRQSLYFFSHELHQRGPYGLQWNDMLTQFGLIQGRINTLLKYIASDRLPKLHNRLIIPQRFTAELDEHLQTVTQNRLTNFTHDDAPLYLRTKLVPELEQVDDELEHAPESQQDGEQVELEIKQLNAAVAAMQQQLDSKRKQFEAKQASWSRPPKQHDNSSLALITDALS